MGSNHYEGNIDFIEISALLLVVLLHTSVGTPGYTYYSQIEASLVEQSL